MEPVGVRKNNFHVQEDECSVYLKQGLGVGKRVGTGSWADRVVALALGWLERLLLALRWLWVAGVKTDQSSG